jgi:hypothetical protein
MTPGIQGAAHFVLKQTGYVESQNSVSSSPTVKPTAPCGMSNGLSFEDPRRRWSPERRRVG